MQNLRFSTREIRFVAADKGANSEEVIVRILSYQIEATELGSLCTAFHRVSMLRMLHAVDDLNRICLRVD
jgi:hypothetical protein